MFDYVYENAVGIKIYSSDWEYIYNYNVSGLNTALKFSKEGNHTSNIQMSHSCFLDCMYGIDVSVMNNMGSSFFNITIACADDEKSSAVRTQSTSKNPIMFNNCSFYTSKGNAVYLEGIEIAQFVNCVFNASDNIDKYVIENKYASLILL